VHDLGAFSAPSERPALRFPWRSPSTNTVVSGEPVLQARNGNQHRVPSSPLQSKPLIATSAWAPLASVVSSRRSKVLGVLAGSPTMSSSTSGNERSIVTTCTAGSLPPQS